MFCLTVEKIAHNFPVQQYALLVTLEHASLLQCNQSCLVLSVDEWLHFYWQKKKN